MVRQSVAELRLPLQNLSLLPFLFNFFSWLVIYLFSAWSRMGFFSSANFFWDCCRKYRMVSQSVAELRSSSKSCLCCKFDWASERTNDLDNNKFLKTDFFINGVVKAWLTQQEIYFRLWFFYQCLCWSFKDCFTCCHKHFRTKSPHLQHLSVSEQKQCLCSMYYAELQTRRWISFFAESLPLASCTSPCTPKQLFETTAL